MTDRAARRSRQVRRQRGRAPSGVAPAPVPGLSAPGPPVRGPRVAVRAPSPGRAPDSSLEAWASWPWLVPLVIGLGLGLRLAHLAAVRGSPFFSALQLDAEYYDEWAQRIAAGEWIGRAAFWVDPLYAYVLAGIYRLAGHDLFLARLANIGFGVATIGVVAGIAQRVWRAHLAAVVAALLVALCIPAIHLEGQIEKTAFTVFLLASALYLFLVGTRRALAAAGVLAGLATLARGNGMLLVPLGALALLCGWDRDPGDPLTATRPQRRQRAALLLAGALPIIGLATLHNYYATGSFVLTTTNLGINLYIGNHAGNVYGYYEPPDFLRPNTQGEVPDFQAEAQQRSGQLLSGGALSSYWAGQTWAALAADPGLAIARTFHKLQLILHNTEIPDTDGVDLVAEWSPVLRAPVFWFGQLVPLAVLGAVVGWRRRGVRIVAAVAATYIASLLPFFVMARLRVQLLPPLAVLGAGAVAWLAAAVRGGRWRSLAYGAAVLAVSALMAVYPPAWMAQRRVSSLAIQWHNLGVALADRGQIDDAIRAHERAVATSDEAVPASLRDLGRFYQARGDYVRAEKSMRRVLELRPNSPAASQALRALYDQMLHDPRWRDDAQVRRQVLEVASAAATNPATAEANPLRAAMSQARALQAAGQFDAAIALLQDRVRQGPYDENLHYYLGDLMAQHAAPDAMAAFFAEELGRDQKPQTSEYFWAVALARRGDTGAATAHLQRALEIDPAHEMSQRQWGLLLEQQGRLDEALAHLVEATRIHPEFKAALEDAARLAERLGRQAEAKAYRDRAATANPNTIRQFVYWARYLHEHGRDDAAAAEVQHMLAQRPDDAEALRLREAIAAGHGATAGAPLSR